MYKIIDVQNSQNNKITNILFWLVAVDVFLLPYMPMIAVSFSVPIIVVWSILNIKELTNKSENLGISILILIMFFSSLLSIFYFGDVRWETSLQTTVMRFFQYSISLCMYVFFKKNFESSNVRIDYFIFLSVIVVSIFALYFFLDSSSYASIKMMINHADNHTRRALDNIVYYRYNYLWTDPNNVAYAVAGLESWFLLYSKMNVSCKYIVFVLALFVIGNTSSIGGLISFTISNLLLVAYFFRKTRKVDVMKMWLVIFGMCLLSFVAIRYLGVIDVVNSFIDSYQMRADKYSTTSNFSGGRLRDFTEAIKFLNPLVILVGSGKEGFSYENGHLYFISMYGFVGYCLFIRLLFTKMGDQSYRDFIWIIPFFVGFTVNIAIGEYKFLGIFLFLLAFCRYSSFRNKEVNKYGHPC